MLGKIKELICILQSNKLARYISAFGAILFCGFAINCFDASAVSYFSGNYSSRVNLYYFDASMPSERGYRSYTAIDNGPVPSITPSNEGRLIPPTGANYYIYTMGLTLHGLTISGGDSSKRYQSAEADAYLYLPQGDSLVGSFDDSDLSCTYYTQSGNYVTVSGSWTEYWEIHPISLYNVVLDCPVVQNSNYDPYVSVDFDLGNFFQNNPQTLPSSYFYRYEGGGGVWFSGGSYQVSSSDNEELNAIENQTYVLEKGFSDVIDAINQQNNLQNEAVDNISNQSASDISNAENQVSTNLIGILQSFLSAITNFSPNGTCNITLDFPQFMGGTRTFNICIGRDLFGNYITIFSSLAMFAFYIPLAYTLLKMIFNEIRSFTNG